jgi:hypothetical protein
MKKLILTTLILLFLGFVAYSAHIYVKYKPSDSKPGYNRKQLKHGELCSFGDHIKYDTTKGKYKLSASRGAYDGSKYKVTILEAGLVKISEVQSARGIHQNELDMFACFGTFKQNHDTLEIDVQSNHSKLYIFNVDKNYVVDSFSAQCMIKVVSQTLDDKYSQTLVTNELGNQVMALPYGVKHKRIWKAFHKKEEVGVFTRLEVSDTDGKFKSYPSDDYVMVGGNILTN